MKLKHSLLCLTSLLLVDTTYGVMATAPSLAATFRADEQININVYRNASPAVVTIIGGNNTGSGSIISPDGLVLTNEHVVRMARGGMVSVQTGNGQRYNGQVLATDAANDLALIQLRTNERLPYLRLAASEGIQVGQQVFAIGSPFGLSGTLTTGILSRIAQNGDLQTDAVLNPGNSGGPLLNSQGELIGVNKAILANQGGNTGIGFATSALIAQQFINQARTGRPSSPIPANPAIATAPPALPPSAMPRSSMPPSQPSAPNPYAGVAPAPNFPAYPGGYGEGYGTATNPPRLGVVLNVATLVVEQVRQGSIAATIGLRPGDQLVALNGRPLRGFADLEQYLNRYPSSVILTVGRNQRLAHVRVDF